MRPYVPAASLFLHIALLALLSWGSGEFFSPPRGTSPLFLSFETGEGSGVVGEANGCFAVDGAEPSGARSVEQVQLNEPTILPRQTTLRMDHPGAKDTLLQKNARHSRKRAERVLTQKTVPEAKQVARNSEEFSLSAKAKALPAATSTLNDAETPSPSGVPEGYSAGKTGLETHGRGYQGQSKGSVPFGGIMGPAFKRFVQPVYPAQARRLGLSASVRLLVSLDAGGIVQNIEILEGEERMFVDSAIKAIRRSEFWPYKPEGKALPCATVISVRFKLND